MDHKNKKMTKTGQKSDKRKNKKKQPKQGNSK